MLDKLDKILKDMVDLAENEITIAKSQRTISKDLIEAVGVILTIAYRRWDE